MPRRLVAPGPSAGPIFLVVEHVFRPDVAAERVDPELEDPPI
jgi:hypothetical protein